MSDALAAARALVAQAAKFKGEAPDIDAATDDHVDQYSVPELAEFHLDAQEWAAAFTTLARWSKSRVGELLGPDRAYRYGDTAFTGNDGGGWVARDEKAVALFALEAGSVDDLLAILNMSKPKVGGIDKVAKDRGLDARTVRRRLVRWAPAGQKGTTISAHAPRGWRSWYPTEHGQTTEKPKQEEGTE